MNLQSSIFISGFAGLGFSVLNLRENQVLVISTSNCCQANSRALPGDVQLSYNRFNLIRII